jgi:hypothetical protein
MDGKMLGAWTFKWTNRQNRWTSSWTQANEQTYGHTDEQSDGDRPDGLTVGQTYMWTD